MSEDVSGPDAARRESSVRSVVPARRRLSTRALELSLLLFLWCVYGAAINSGNLDAFNLQQAGVEAMVERRQFSLEGSDAPKLQIRVYYDGDKPFGDTFLYDGRQYAAKQPGQFMAGALVYFVLRLLGLNYVENYLLVSALVTFFTTSLITAAAAVAVFRLAREFTGGDTLLWPLAVALVYGLGTIAFVYSGIAHHDGLASGYLVIAFHFVVSLARERTSGRSAKVVAGVAGLMLGLTITTSMLPVFMVCVVGIYFVSLRRWELIVPALLGGVAGVAPLLIYNALSFGNPLLPPNIAGGYPDSYLHFDPHNTVAKARFYVSEITYYLPIVWAGLVGLAFYPRDLWRERLVMLGMLLALVFQILNIETHGGCHYGPRFLLPAMPYACLGLIGLRNLRAPTPRRLVLAAIVLVGAASVFITSVGALYGAMYCEIEHYALWPYLAALWRGEWRVMPLAAWLVAPLVLCMLLLASACRNYQRARASELSTPVS